MPQQNDLKKIFDELRFLRKVVVEIKSHIADIDDILTEDDIKALHEAEKDLRDNKVARLV